MRTTLAVHAVVVLSALPRGSGAPVAGMRPSPDILRLFGTRDEEASGVARDGVEQRPRRVLYDDPFYEHPVTDFESAGAALAGADHAVEAHEEHDVGHEEHSVDHDTSHFSDEGHQHTPHNAGDGAAHHENAHGDHGDDAHGHDAHGDHGCDGDHGHGDHKFEIDDEMALALMLALIALSIVFEKTKHMLEHAVDAEKHMILQALFGELTVLGFIALVTFFLMEGGLFESMSLRIYHDKSHLLHLFEKVHFGLFFVMIGFLVLIGWLIFVQGKAAARWQELDKAAGEYLLEQRGKRAEVDRLRRQKEQEAALEAATEARRRAKQLHENRDEDESAIKPPAVPPPSDDYLKARYGEGGAIPIGFGNNAGYTRQIDDDQNLDLDESTDDWRLRKENPQLFAFLQMRQRFVVGLSGIEGKRIKLNDPNDTFNFGQYLNRCSAFITSEIVEVHFITWILVALTLTMVYLFNAFVSHSVMCVILMLWGWFCYALLKLLTRDMRRIQKLLSPPPTASLEQIREDVPEATPEYMLAQPTKDMDKHEALFPFGWGHSGPEWYVHLVRTVLLDVAVYVIGLMQIFAKEMLEEPGVLGVLMLALSLLSVLATLAELLNLFPPLVAVQSIGMMKNQAVVNKTFRDQKLELSLRLLKLLTSMQSHSRQLRKLKSKAVAGEEAQTAEQVAAEQAQAMAVLDANPQQKEQLTAAFKLFDTTGDNNIDSFELKGLLRSMGQKVSDDEAQQLLNEMDADGSGSVSLEEFLTVMASEVNEAAEPEQTVAQIADEMFEILDEDNSGEVSFLEFRNELKKLPTGMNDEDIDELLQEMFGGGGDTKIDKHEFMQFIELHKAELDL